MAAGEPDPFESTRMTLGEHLEELRRRLFVGIAAIVVLFLVAWAFSDESTRVVTRPYRVMIEKLRAYYAAEAEEALAADPTIPREHYFERVGDEEVLRLLADTRMTAVAPGEGFFFTLKVCFYLALFLGAPVLLWQLWMFVAAGLYPKERRIVLRTFPSALLLFVGGVLFGYFLLVPYGMYFLNRTMRLEEVRPDFRLQEYFGFLSSLCLGLGVVFQLPIAMVVAAKIGLVTPRWYGRYRGHMWVGTFVVCGFLTPPDPYTQSMMAIPVLLLYELGIAVSKLAVRANAKALKERTA